KQHARAAGRVVDPDEEQLISGAGDAVFLPEEVGADRPQATGSSLVTDYTDDPEWAHRLAPFEVLELNHIAA
ncbi:unnamed protein product, partial [Amoebophrya sp. A25]